ncbi:MAG: O-antigen ligase family protein [Lachnospiraceae bacterium]
MANKMAINTVVASFMYGIQIVTVFLVTYKMIKRNGVYVFVNWLARIFGCFAVLSDLLMLFVRYDFSNPSEEYLIGNKFVIAYIHCLWTALVFYKYKMLDVPLLRNGKANCKKLKYAIRSIMTAALSFFICMRVTTSTGMIAIVVLTVLMIMPIRIQKILSSNYALIATAGIMNILNFGTAQLMMNAHVQYFIQNVLGKSSTLSGRSQIWAIIFRFISKKALIGYGYYNGMIERHLGYGNPQNGVLKILLDTGIIGLLLYGILVFIALRPLNGKNFVNNFPMIAFLYAMLVASLVEINLTHMIVFMALAIIAFGCERKEINL